MGCVSSRQDINDIHPNIFQVMNVDENGQHVSPGQLELTEVELVLYQRGKATMRWPLRSLRRYGFDAEIFSFESGRRCPTGPGIYAFRCRRAEQLFNLLQRQIQLRNLSEDLVTVASELSVPVIPPPVASRQMSDQNYVESVNNRTVVPRTQNNRFIVSRPGSITSMGPASPPSTSSPTPLTTESTLSEHNNNKRIQHSYSNTAPVLDVENVASSTTQPYMNIEPATSPTLSSSSEPYAQLNMESETECCHMYMNVTPGETAAAVPKNVIESPVLLEYDDEKEESEHCYANLNPGDMESLSCGQQPLTTIQNQFPVIQYSNSCEQIRKVHYIVLDLDQTKVDAGNTTPAVESPRKPPKGYATIDFNKTVALSHSVNPCLDLDNEGSRKTRHNSTIGELAPVLARHSTSLSD